MAETSASAENAQGAHGDGREYLVFAVGEGRYALPMEPVDEILRVPVLTPVPLSPAGIVGALNLRGRVLPVADLRHLLGYPESAPDDHARILVTEARGGLGLLVDAVLEATTIDPGRIRPVGNVTELAQVSWLDGMVQCDQGLVQCMDLGRLVDGAGLAAQPPGQQETGGALALGETGEADKTAEAQYELLGLQVGDQTFGVRLDTVVEILHEPERVSPVSDAPPAVVGVIEWRNRTLPLVDLAGHFGLEPADTDERRVLVVPLAGDRAALDGPLVGLRADRVREVLRVPARQVDAIPETMRQTGSMDECSAVARLDDKRLVSILDADRLMASSDARRSAVTGDGDAASGAAGTEAPGAEQFVLFDLAGTPYGVPIEAVKEIIRPPEQLTRVPRAPDLVDGALNLRGAILPVIGLRRHLGLGPVPEAESARVLVLRRDVAWLGFGVDAMLGAQEFAPEAMRPAPRNATRHADLLTRVATDADGRMILLLDPAGLAARVEAAAEEQALKDREAAC